MLYIELIEKTCYSIKKRTKNLFIVVFMCIVVSWFIFCSQPSSSHKIILKGKRPKNGKLTLSPSFFLKHEKLPPFIKACIVATHVYREDFIY